MNASSPASRVRFGSGSFVASPAASASSPVEVVSSSATGVASTSSADSASCVPAASFVLSFFSPSVVPPSLASSDSVSIASLSGRSCLRLSHTSSASAVSRTFAALFGSYWYGAVMNAMVSGRTLRVLYASPASPWMDAKLLLIVIDPVTAPRNFSDLVGSARVPALRTWRATAASSSC